MIGCQYDVVWQPSESERKRQKLRKSHIGAAAFLIRDVVLGEYHPVDDPAAVVTGESGGADVYDPHCDDDDETTAAHGFVFLHATFCLWCRRWCRLVDPRWFSLVTVVARHFSLPRDLPLTDYANDDSMTVENDCYYPNTGTGLWLTVPQSRGIEAILLISISTIVLARIGRGRSECATT